MADNAFVKIGTALLKHQVKKLVGEEAMGAIGAELADIGGDKLDAWLGDKSTTAEIEKAAITARDLFHGKVNDDEVEQWMVMLPIHDLPAVLSAIEELPKSPDETKLENALRESIALNWKRLSPAQVDNSVNAFLSALRSALLPIEKQTLMVIGRSVLRTEDKVNQLLKLVENLQAIRPETPKWFFGHRYGDLDSFTGRATEMDMLNAWLNNDKDNLLMLRALGGFGKSALAWTWFNRVDREQWQTAVWWSFYEKESGFESFLAETLKHLGVEVKQSARQQVNDLLEALHGTNTLIVLDGFERLLRQYGRMDAALQPDDEDADIDPSQRDCSSPLTETFLRGLSGAGMKSKVLMTTRLTPRILESKNNKLLKGCREELLQGFSPDDARAYFKNEGISAARAEIIEVCSLYGYHPLSLNLLVGWINREEGNNHRGDIIEAKNLDIFDSIIANRHHVLERAYESLAPERRDLLSKISCFRGSMEYAVLKKVFPSPDLDKALLDLRKRGLLQYVGETQRYDMHPIVRHYAYDHFTDEKRRKEAHVQLAMHFIDVMPVTNKNVKTLEDLAPVIELYYHMVKSGQLDLAIDIYHRHLAKPLFFQFCVYLTIIELLRELFPDGENTFPQLKKSSDQGWALNALGLSYSNSGQIYQSISTQKIAITLTKNKRDIARNIGNLAADQLAIGALGEANYNLRYRIILCRETQNKYDEAYGHAELGHFLSYAGLWDEARDEFLLAIEIFEKIQHTQQIGVVWAYRALHFLLIARSDLVPKPKLLTLALECAEHSLRIAEEVAQKEFHAERDYIRAYWLLGATYLMNGVSTGSTTDLTLAEENLSKALNLCRQINLVESEANILLDLARLRYAQGDFKDAQEKASEALMITERSGYVLQGADVNLFLAQYALEQEKDKVKAKEHAESALRLAYCDGPPYYYKVAYEEAVAMLESLK